MNGKHGVDTGKNKELIEDLQDNLLAETHHGVASIPLGEVKRESCSVST